MHRRAIPALLLLIISLTFATPCRAQMTPYTALYSTCQPFGTKSCRLAAQLAYRFYPPSLINPKHPKYHSGCYDLYSTTKNGIPLTIFADYTRHRGEFLVIRRKANGEYWAAPVAPSAQVIGPHGDIFGQDAGCAINLIPLSPQGKRAIFLQFSAMADLGTANAMRWVFQWNGTKAKNLGPVRHTPAGYVPGWGDAENLYIYPNSLAMLSSYEHNSRGIPKTQENHPFYHRIYRLKKGRYKFVTYAAYVGVPMPATSGISGILGPWVPVSGPFMLRRNSTGPYILRIGNGILDGRWRVTGAEIWINGKEIVPPNEINSKTSILIIPLRHVLKRHNTIKVIAHGKSSFLSLVIEDHTPNLFPETPKR